jgi:hypothetical protein
MVGYNSRMFNVENIDHVDNEMGICNIYCDCYACTLFDLCELGTSSGQVHMFTAEGNCVRISLAKDLKFSV